MESVDVEPRSLESYRGVAPDEQLEEISALAGRLSGARVLHVNATAFGGGAAETLASLVPLLRDVGLPTEWRVMQADPEFFEVTKAMHNALQGADEPLDERAREDYLRYSKQNADALCEEEYDLVVIHDPQPAAVRALMLEDGRGGSARWVWRCHIDLTDANRETWDFLRPYVEAYDAAVFTAKGYVKPDLKIGYTALIPPSIDPLHPKNDPLPYAEAAAVLERYGVDPDRPLLAQVSRYDLWKDPVGAVDIYRAAREEAPDLQLALVATLADDDPEDAEYLERTARHAGEDPDVHLLASSTDNSRDVNAFQVASGVVLQNSKREGFGLVVTEALWKGTPVVARNVGGIPLQLRDGRDGYLVESDGEAAERIVRLLRDPDLRAKLGASGRENVRRNFLVTRYLLDYLRLSARLLLDG